MLHRGTPTDRLIAEWWIQRPHVERRIAASSRDAGGAGLLARDSRAADAPVLNVPASREPWDVAAAAVRAVEGRA